MTNAAREGARVGVLPSYTCADGDRRREEPRRRLHGGVGLNAASYQVKQTYEAVGTAGREQSSTPASCPSKITQPLPMLGTFSAFFGGGFGNVPLRATSVMRTEAQAAPSDTWSLRHEAATEP